MKTIDAKVRSWGRSLGMVIPREAVLKENLKEGDTIQILIKKEGKNPLKKTFGILKGHINTKQLLKEADKELWND